MVIAFCFNVKKNLASTDPNAQKDAEFDSPETIAAIKNALKSGGHQVIEIEANQEAYLSLYKHREKIDVVFNISEGIDGDAREAQIPAFCDMLRLPYTHSSTLTHALSLDKAITKKILTYHGIQTPKFQLFTKLNQELKDLDFPILLKPNAEGSSKGIMDKNLVHTSEEFSRRLKWLLHEYKIPVLAEEFLPGREFTVALLGNPPKVLPIIEQRLDRLPKDMAPFASYEVKWLWEDTLPDPTSAYDCPAKLTPSLKKSIDKICIATYKALNCLDCARIDLRLDKKGNPSVLEINTLPGMMPDKMGISYMPIAARAAGLPYAKMILEILNAAKERYQIS